MGNKEVMENYGKNFLSVIEEKVATASGFNWLSPVFFSKGNYAFKGKPYKGINQLFLTLIKAVKGYDSSCWITYKKAGQQLSICQHLLTNSDTARERRID